MGFQTFNRRSARISRDPWITIQKRGTFSLNAASAAMLAGGDDPDGLPVELLFDPDEKIVGIRRAEDETNAYTLRKQANSESYLLSGKSFTEHYGIKTGFARRFAAREVGEGIVGFALSDPCQEVGRTT